MQGLQPGDYTAEVKVLSAGRRMSGQTPVLIRKHVPGETKIDHLRRCVVVDGRPRVLFMPMVMTYHGLGDDRFWRFFSERGMNEIMIAPGRPHMKMLGDYLARAEKFGVKVLYFCGVNKELINRNNLLGWLVVDEPLGEERVKEVIETVGKARETDPHHIIYCNHFPHTMAANYAGLPGDIVSIDYYPIPCTGRSIREIGNLTREMEEFARPRRIPTWFFVQGSGLHMREPTALELSAQTYMVIVNGGTGVLYFFGEPHGQRAWERFLKLNEEIKQLNDILLSIEEPPAFSQRRGGEIYSTVRKFRGSVYIIAVNGSRETINEVFTLPGVSGKAEVLFEGRVLEMKKNRLADRFGPLERHVYKMRTE